MPRAINGDYSLPAGNPVVTGTVISSTWANDTLSDLAQAMTDSLSRSGDGGMTAGLKLADGAIGAPGLTWGNETTAGFYRAGAGDFRYAIGGVDVFLIGSSTTTAARFTSTSVGAPSTPNFLATNSRPLFMWYETDASLDNKAWYFDANAEQFRGIAINDAFSASATWLAVDRTGSAIDSVVLTATNGGSVTLTVGNTLGGLTSVGGAMTQHMLISDANPSYYINETDAAANEKVWRLNAVAGDLVWSTRTDANGGGATFMTVARTGTTIDTVTFAATTLAYSATALSITGLATFNTPGSNAAWPINIDNNQPGILFREADAAADNRIWRTFIAAEELRMDVLNDAASVAASWLVVNRTAAAVDSIVLQTSGAALTVGASAITSSVTLTSTAFNATSTTPTMRMVETDAAANEQIWDWVTSGGALSYRTRTDVDGAGVSWLVVDRTGTTVDSIVATATSISLLGILFTTGARFEIENTVPMMQMDETDAPANERSWLIFTSAGDWRLSSATDAAPQAAAATAITVTRTGTVIDAIQLTSATVTSAGTLTVAADIISSNAAPRLAVNETDAAVDNRLWRIGVSSETLVWGTRNDADSSGNDFLSVDRTSTTVDSVKWATPIFEIESATPLIQIDETDAAANERNWLVRSSAGILAISTATDAAPTTAVENAITIDRTGTAVTSVNITGTSISLNGPVTSTSQVIQSGAISPAALSSGGTTDDWAPTGLAGASVIRIDLAGNHTINGLTGGVAGRIITFININNTFSITVANEAAGSAAANRFAVNTAPIANRTSRSFWYDGVSSRWREFSS